jgi:hypothetical protein
VTNECRYGGWDGIEMEILGEDEQRGAGWGLVRKLRSPMRIWVTTQISASLRYRKTGGIFSMEKDMDGAFCIDWRNTGICIPFGVFCS